MNWRAGIVLMLLLASSCRRSSAPENAAPIELTQHSQLLADDSLIDRMEGLTRVLNQPKKLAGNPIMKADRPWEDGQVVLQPGTVIFDSEEKVFKMWYEAPTTHPDRMPASVMCYATSPDGIRWQKAQLNVTEFRGSKANNIVFTSELLRNNWFAHSVIRDSAEPDPQRRYKMVYWDEPANKYLGICVAFSPDGIHWTKFPGNPVVPHWASGDNFCVMRNPETKQYVMNHRSAVRPVRRIARLVSDDFIHWRDDRLILEPDIYDQPDTEFYGMSAFPYAGNYLGLLWVFHQYPQTIDTQMTFSRDFVHWTRVANRKIFLPLGYMILMYGGKSFDSAMVFPASAPVRVGEELWIYYSGFDKIHNVFEENHGGIGLAKLRVDGFCSLDATNEGYVVTRPLKFQGSNLFVNAATYKVDAVDANLQDPVWKGLFPANPGGSGWIRVEVQDEQGEALGGYAVSDSEPLRGDNTSHQVSWKSGKTLAALKGRGVRFKFVVSSAKLYSFRVQ